MQVSRKYYQNTRPEVFPFLPAPYKTVLERGCGEGGFIENLNSDCEVWGVEADEISAGAALGKFHTLLPGNYSEVANQLPNRYFDLVICNDVIEHMTDHDAFLASIKDKIKTNGCIVASVPNVRHYKNLFELFVKKDWQYQDHGILDTTHFRFFTAKSLKRSFEAHGYVTEKFSGINPPKSIVARILLFCFSVLTLGFHRDIKYLQFGIRAKKPD